jgi:putative oxidoreductase
MIRVIIRLLETLAPIADLAIRLWVANVFFSSGLTKFQTMDSTLWLFENEYAAPLLPPAVAAYLATGFSSSTLSR